MKNSLVIFAIGSLLFAGQAFAQGTTVTTHKSSVTTTTTIPHGAEGAPSTVCTTKTMQKTPTPTTACEGADCETPKSKVKGKKKVKKENNNM